MSITMTREVRLALREALAQALYIETHRGVVQWQQNAFRRKQVRTQAEPLVSAVVAFVADWLDEIVQQNVGVDHEFSWAARTMWRWWCKEGYAMPEGRAVMVKDSLTEVGVGSVEATMRWESSPTDEGAIVRLDQRADGDYAFTLTDAEEFDGAYASVAVTLDDLLTLHTRLTDVRTMTLVARRAESDATPTIR